jgi:CheY-like chemotaxis protein
MSQVLSAPPIGRSAVSESMSIRDSRKLLLVIEDNSIDREWFNLVLRRAGHEVAVAGHGEQAVDYLLAGMVPDLILLDMLLPVLDGWHLLELLKREERFKGVPILVTSAASTITSEWAAAHGCAGILRKPIDDEESLLSEIRRCLNGPA